MSATRWMFEPVAGALVGVILAMWSSFASKSRGLMEQAIEEGRVDPRQVTDGTLREFQEFLQRHHLGNIVVGGGAARDIFLRTSSADIDVGLAIDLTEEDRRLFAEEAYVASERVVEESGRAARGLAGALGVHVNDLLNPQPGREVRFGGLAIQFIGPAVLSAPDGTKALHRRLLFDVSTKQSYPQNMGASLLQMAVDGEGNLYGHRDALRALQVKQVTFSGPEKGVLLLGDVLRALHLKHGFGLAIPKRGYDLIRKSLDMFGEGFGGYVPLLSDQVQKIIRDARDPKVAQAELDELGIPKTLESAQRVSREEALGYWSFPEQDRQDGGQAQTGTRPLRFLSAAVPAGFAVNTRSQSAGVGPGFPVFWVVGLLSLGFVGILAAVLYRRYFRYPSFRGQLVANTREVGAVRGLAAVAFYTIALAVFVGFLLLLTRGISGSLGWLIFMGVAVAATVALWLIAVVIFGLNNFLRLIFRFSPEPIVLLSERELGDKTDADLEHRLSGFNAYESGRAKAEQALAELIRRRAIAQMLKAVASNSQDDRRLRRSIREALESMGSSRVSEIFDARRFAQLQPISDFLLRYPRLATVENLNNATHPVMRILQVEEHAKRYSS